MEHTHFHNFGAPMQMYYDNGVFFIGLHCHGEGEGQKRQKQALYSRDLHMKLQMKH